MLVTKYIPFVDKQLGDVMVLTDARLWELSQYFTNNSDLREIGLIGLQIPSRTLEKHIWNSNRITEAAYKVLNDWRNTQPDTATAHRNLLKALDTARKPFLKQALVRY